MFTRTSTPFIGRNREQVRQLFEGFDLVEPGLVLWCSGTRHTPTRSVTVPSAPRHT